MPIHPDIMDVGSGDNSATIRSIVEHVPVEELARAIQYDTLLLYYQNMCAGEPVSIDTIITSAESDFNTDTATTLLLLKDAHTRVRSAADVALKHLKYKNKSFASSRSKLFHKLSMACKCVKGATNLDTNLTSLILTISMLQPTTQPVNTNQSLFDDAPLTGPLGNTKNIIIEVSSQNADLYIAICSAQHISSGLPLVMQTGDDIIGFTLDDFILDMETVFTQSLFMTAGKILKKQLLYLVDWNSPP